MISQDIDIIYTPIPERIARLRELAYNLWWSWHPEARYLYEQIDPDLWEMIYHSPTRFLREVRQQSLKAAAENADFLQQYDSVMTAFDAYMSETDTWFARHYPEAKDEMIAYFSAEFGMHESLPIYSGGLGILSGDHVKEASDMGMPFVAVGFIYPQGYFRQRLDQSGWQLAEYPKLIFAESPAIPARTAEGEEVVIGVDLPGRTIYAKVYRMQIGRVTLLMMDTDIHPNTPQDRELSARLYGGDQEMRIAQEMVLGIGGVRALRKLGINPTVWHMNEGHSAFLVLELTRELVVQGIPFQRATEQVKQHTIFTTHTPVPAGNDAFPIDKIEKFFSGYWPQLGIDRDQFLSLAHQQQSWGPTFAMTVLAIQMSTRRNGVSKLHGHVARGMWNWLFPHTPRDEVPITSVTNGVHSASWLASEMRELFDKYLGSDWERNLEDPATWQAMTQVPNKDLWEARNKLRRRLIRFARERVQAHLKRNDPNASIPSILNDTTFTIGFARRFATYKRATLIFKDIDRMRNLLSRPDRPVQIIFAGKAHPADNPGKHFIQDIYRYSQEYGFNGRIVFLEEYDIAVGRAMVQGVDLWLNTPRRPYEASGTSGQKASLNGAPNASILDGWWPEAYNGKNGWAIGEEREYMNQDEQDWNDAQSFYHIFENQIIPLFYERDEDGIPNGWLEVSKQAIMTVAPQFSMRRMLADYLSELYIPAAMGESVA
ncbi:MAG: glycosyltransferase family 1 protein [Chloroflexaceae bacterium]|nr:glycosyltransferase family 1 protein [Chloroflexaceae bacterium]